MEKVNNKKQPDNKTKSVILILVVGLFIGGFIGYLFGHYLFASEKENTKNQITLLSGQINEIQVETFNNNENTKNIIEELQGRLSQIQEQIEDLSGEINNSGQNLIETSNEIASLEAQIFSITEQIGNLEDNIENAIQDFYSISNENISLSLLFEQVRESVVVIQGLIPQTGEYLIVQGSGFVYNYSGNMWLF